MEAKGWTLYNNVAHEYLDYKIHDIHAVQGLGGIIEMIVYIKKMYAITKA